MATAMKLGVSYKLDLSKHMQFGPFTDVRNSPQFTITFVPVAEIPSDARELSAKQFDHWISGLALTSKNLHIR